eukprot:TRINITY_DN19544_c0_g4_i1.p1 TRINITY_DN19544_c0_g4~~TRINITY_DN19544_c0_g4_i1.p1  ORF type:complete len:2016 (+),score=684.54 TRINITY_DN19544_c0_g4_i1:261-6050(+)
MERAIVAADAEARGAYAAVEAAVRYQIDAAAAAAAAAVAPAFLASQRAAVTTEADRVAAALLAAEGDARRHLASHQLASKALGKIFTEQREAREAARVAAWVAACEAEAARVFEQFVAVYKISADVLFNAAVVAERAQLRGAAHRHRAQELWDRRTLVDHVLNTPGRPSTAAALDRLREYPMPEYDMPDWDDPHPLDPNLGGVVAVLPAALALPGGWFYRVADTVERLPVYELAPRGMRDLIFTIHSQEFHWVLTRTRVVLDADGALLSHTSLAMLKTETPHSGHVGETPGRYQGAWLARGGASWLDAPADEVWEAAPGAVVMINAASRPRDCVFTERVRWAVDEGGRGALASDLLEGVVLTQDLEVVGVGYGTVAEKAGMVEGSFIILVNGHPVATPRDVHDALRDVPSSPTDPPRITIELRPDPPAARTSSSLRPYAAAAEPAAPRGRRVSIGCSVARWRRSVVADASREDRFREKLLRLWRSKPGTVMEELVLNGVFPPGADPLLVVSTAATEVMKNRGVDYHSQNSVELLVLALYTMAGPDIDRLYGFKSPMYDANYPDEWNAYCDRFRDRNPSIAPLINGALRTAFSAVGPAADEAWMTLGRWAKFVGVLIALCSVPLGRGADPFLASPFEVEPDEGHSVLRGVAGLPEGVLEEHLAAAEAGATLVWPGAASCTRNAGVASDALSAASASAAADDDISAGAPLCFVVSDVNFGLSLHQLSQYPCEDEHLLPPLTRVTVAKASRGGGAAAACDTWPAPALDLPDAVPVLHVRCAAAGVGEAFQADVWHETAEACSEACQLVLGYWRHRAPRGTYVEVLCPRAGWSPMRRASVAARRSSVARGEPEFAPLPDYVSTGGLSGGRKPLWYLAEVVRYIEDRLTVVVRFMAPEQGGAEVPLDPACLRLGPIVDQPAEDFMEARLPDLVARQRLEVQTRAADRAAMFGRILAVRVRVKTCLRLARRQLGVWKVEGALAAVASQQHTRRLAAAKALRIRHAAVRIQRSWGEHKIHARAGEIAAAVAVQRLWRGHHVRKEAAEAKAEGAFKQLLGLDLEDGWEQNVPEAYFDQCDELSSAQAGEYMQLVLEEQEGFAALSKRHLELASKGLGRDAQRKHAARGTRAAVAPLQAELLQLEADKLAKSRAVLARHQKSRRGKLADHQACIDNLSNVVADCMQDTADIDSSLYNHALDNQQHALAKTQADVQATLAGLHRIHAEKRAAVAVGVQAPATRWAKTKQGARVPAEAIPVAISLTDPRSEEVVRQVLHTAAHPGESCFAAGEPLPGVAVLIPEHVVFLPPGAAHREDPLLPREARDWVRKGAAVSAYLAGDAASTAILHLAVLWNNALRVIKWTPRRLWAASPVYTSPVLCGGTWPGVVAFPLVKGADPAVGVAYFAPATGAFGVSALPAGGAPAGGGLGMTEVVPQRALEGCELHAGLTHAASTAAPGVHYFLVVNRFHTAAALWACDLRCAPPRVSAPSPVPLHPAAAGVAQVSLAVVGNVPGEAGREALAVTASGLTSVSVFRVDAVHGGDVTFSPSLLYCKLPEPGLAAVVAPAAAGPGTGAPDAHLLVFARTSGVVVAQRIPALTTPLAGGDHKPFLVAANVGVVRTAVASRAFACVAVAAGWKQPEALPAVDEAAAPSSAGVHPLLAGFVADEVSPVREREVSPVPSPVVRPGVLGAARPRGSVVSWAVGDDARSEPGSGGPSVAHGAGPRSSVGGFSRPPSASLRDRIGALKNASRPASAASRAASERTVRSTRTAFSHGADRSTVAPPAAAKHTIPQRQALLEGADPFAEHAAQAQQANPLALQWDEDGACSMAARDLTDAAARGLLSALPMAAGLKALDLSQNLLTDGFVEDLLGMLRYTSLTELDLSHNLLTEHGAGRLAASLGANRKLAALRLYGNDWESEDLPALHAIKAELAARAE